MFQFIITHNTSGQAVFSSKVPEQRHDLDMPYGNMQMLYTGHSFPMNLSTEADIDQYSHDRTNGLAGGAICPPGGSAGGIVCFAPNLESPMHRTVTMDWAVIIQGEVDLVLDSGEVRRLKEGDSIVMRGTMHKWINRTPNDGWAKMVAFAQDILPVEIGGKKLAMEFLA